MFDAARNPRGAWAGRLTAGLVTVALGGLALAAGFVVGRSSGGDEPATRSLAGGRPSSHPLRPVAALDAPTTLPARPKPKPSPSRPRTTATSETRPLVADQAGQGGQSGQGGQQSEPVDDPPVIQVTPP